MSTTPPLPPSFELDLPGRGRTWAYDSGPPSSPDGAADGAAVLLLHGWTSTAALNWYRCFPALTSRYRVVALDHRGHGRGIRSRMPFRLEDCADDAAALIDELELGPTTVVGYSMGGPIAQLMWRRRPDVVRELVLCATAARFTRSGQLRGPLGAIGLRASMALSLVPAGLRRSGMTYATARWTANGNAADWASVEWSRHDPTALIQAGLVLSRFDSTSWVGRIDVPTAVVTTELDSTVPTRRQHRMAEAIAGAQTFPVQGTHRACVDQPREFVPALLAACEAVRHRSFSPASGSGSAR